MKELIGHTLTPLLEMYETEDNKLVLYLFRAVPILVWAFFSRDDTLTQLTSMPAGYETLNIILITFRHLLILCLLLISLFSRSVASSLCVGLAETINEVGPAFIEGRTS